MPGDLIHLTHAFFLPVAGTVGEVWQPATDVYRTPQGWLVKLDLAGVRPEDIRWSVSGSCLTIEGVRRDWCQEEGCCHYAMEISYSSFQRRLTLPDDLQGANVSVEYRHGMLLVRIQLESQSR
jgi:HSP20 family protein